MSTPKAVRPSGHLQVKGSNGARKFYALWTDGTGRHHRLLGPAHVRDSGKRTPRNAVIWRAGNGPKPTPEHLTPDDAAVLLRELLSNAPKVAAPVAGRFTFKDACDEWLRYVEHERQLAPSTMRDYRQTVKTSLYPGLGEATPLRSITTAKIDAFREEAAN